MSRIAKPGEPRCESRSTDAANLQSRCICRAGHAGVHQDERRWWGRVTDLGGGL
jgi:hypothetical protein